MNLNPISSLDSSFESIEMEPLPEERTPTWKKIAALEWAGTGLATAGSIHAASRRRKITLPSGGNLGTTAPVEITIEDVPLPTLDPLSSSSPPVQNRFLMLRCTTTDQKDIRLVVERLAKKKYLNPFVAYDLQYVIEPRLDPVHPFRFLWAIFSKHDLAHLMVEKIQHDSFAKWGFMRGVNKGMKKFMLEGSMKWTKIDPYIDEFAVTVGTTGEAIRPLILKGAQCNDWTGLVDHLIGVAAARRV